MLKQLRDIFDKTLINADQEDAQSREHALRLATATLLISVLSKMSRSG